MASRIMKGSFLRMTADSQDYVAKVLSFSSDTTSNINSVQTQRMQQHFPFKVTQPNLSLTLQMRDKHEAYRFQRFVRISQGLALSRASLVNFFWPERSMNDWRGMIMSVQAGEKVGETSPILMIEVALADSMVSQRTWASSQASDFEQIYAGEIAYIPLIEPNRQDQPPGTFTGGLKPPTSITTETGKDVSVNAPHRGGM